MFYPYRTIVKVKDKGKLINLNVIKLRVRNKIVETRQKKKKIYAIKNCLYHQSTSKN